MHRVLSKIICGILLWSLPASGLFGQAGQYWPQIKLGERIERRMMHDKLPDHFSVQPFAIRDIDTILAAMADTALVFPRLGYQFWEVPDTGKWALDVTPLIDAGLGWSSQVGAVYRAAPGLAVNLRYGSTWSFYADALGGSERPAAYIGAFIDSSGVIPGTGKNFAREGDPAFFQPTARLSFAPGTIFSFDLGYGKNFIGSGYRSLFLSDVASNYPYLKITTDVWHFKYINIYAALQGSPDAHAFPDDFRSKYSTTHYLSWAVSPRFNMGLFETIVWQGSDSLSRRGFDPNYLNPVIFYRPVEYSVGSPDNALIGLDLSFKASKSTLLYSQWMFDEFLLSSLRNRDGWWANKWGVQLGVMTWDVAGIRNLNLRGEFNCVRPFTYTHGSTLQNFAHFNEPLAHRLGTNFYEGLIDAAYERKGWFAELKIIWSEYGRDPDSLNLGGDIFKSYENPSMQYGNTIAQGVRTVLYRQSLTAGYVLNRSMNLRAGIRYTFRHTDTEGMPDGNEHVLGFFLATRIYNSFADF